jgi:cytochrome c peroxidase
MGARLGQSGTWILRGRRCARLHLALLLPLAFCAVLLAPSVLSATNDDARQNELPTPDTRRALGQRLFFDRQLSADGRVACASCHQPALALTDGLPVSTGTGAKSGRRNAPSLFRVSEQRSLFWDGRSDKLETQALSPFLNPVEHGLPDGTALLALLRADPGYVVSFQAAFGPGDSLTLSNLGRALAAFERTFDDGASPFDRYLSGELGALSESARRGWVLFRGVARCTRCHLADGPSPLLTDHGFHGLGIGLKAIERRLPELTQRLVKLQANPVARDHAILQEGDVAALGRFVVTLNPADIGKFKTPSLRNVALTAPYMHDGSVATLLEAVELEIYYRSAQDGRPLILTPTDKMDLVAFLESLTGSLAAQMRANPATALPLARRR